MSSFTNFEIIAGTYEEYLLGYLFSSEERTLVHSFASHDHSSSIRCLSTCDSFLASGASDDRIVVYDLKTRKEHCMLTHHDSTVTALAFTSNHSHIISASQDGALAIVRVGNWQLEKLWEKAHKEGYILDIALHSSGKLALTLGTDGTIHTWNLVKGRAAYIINLNTKCKDPKSLERIIFAPDDTRFVLFGGKYTEIWSIEIGGVLKVIEHDQKVTCCDWLDNNTLFVGYEDGQLGTINLETERKKIKYGHKGRVKVVRYFEGFITTASSTGQIKVWTRKLKEISTIDTGCRITCLCIARLIGKLKKEEPEEDMNINQVTANKPTKRSVTVEVDTSSEEEGYEIAVAKKRKKKKQNVVTNGQELAFENNDEVIVKKNKKAGDTNTISNEDGSEKILKQSKRTEGQSKLNIKRKKKKIKTVDSKG